METLMRKMQENRKNNKGFTLVELIIVIAIIAVLAAVLAPQYLKYVENSRVATDKNAVDEIRHAVEISLTNETVNSALTATGNQFQITITSAGVATFSSTPAAIRTEVITTISESSYVFKSDTYQGHTVTIPITVTGGIATVGAASIGATPSSP